MSNDTPPGIPGQQPIYKSSFVLSFYRESKARYYHVVANSNNRWTTEVVGILKHTRDLSSFDAMQKIKQQYNFKKPIFLKYLCTF